MSDTFLNAEWRKLLVVNYAINKNLLAKYLPAKTALDLRNNQCYISVVGFMFLNTKIKGIKIPFHVNFEEINLRFYVRYKEKRGLVFIKEIVSKPALAFVANTFYKENYETLATSHRRHFDNGKLFVEYGWRKSKHVNSIKAEALSHAIEIQPESEEEFFLEHYWGYAKINDKKTTEYEVQHPKWKIYNLLHYDININFELTYGKDFGFLSNENPASVFLAEGSEISVKNKRIIQ